MTMFLSTLISAQKKEIVAYFPQWGIEHQPYYVKYIESTGSADKITIINYAFSEPKPDSSGNIIAGFMNSYYDYQQLYNSEMSIDGIGDDSAQPLRGHFNQLKKLKARHPNLKIVISIGGWTGSVYLSDAALTPESREIFVNSYIEIFIHGNLPIENGAGGIGVASGIFDGIDLDWEFPIAGGIEGIHHNEKDDENLSKLFKLFREKLDSINPDLLLTAAVPATEPGLYNFNFKEDQKYLNWYNLMTYDYKGAWDKSTGHHTNLLSSEDSKNSFDNSIKLFRDKYGVSSNKIIPGAAFYGRSWKVGSMVNNGLYQEGHPAHGIYEDGFNYYQDIITLLSKGFKYYWDDTAMAPYIFNEEESIFYTFDDAKSIALKAQYVDAYNLRGLMFWEISGDDSNGTLVNTIYTRKMPDIKNYIKESRIIGTNKIKINSPRTSDQFKKGSNIIINTETSSSIIKVLFFCDGKLLGYDSTFPFSWVWFNANEGEHELKVEAADHNGNIINSETIVIKVK